MVQCPKCKSEVAKPYKTWKYGRFNAEGYRCSNCGASFREYTKDGKHSFTLMLKNGKFRKVA